MRQERNRAFKITTWIKSSGLHFKLGQSTTLEPQKMLVVSTIKLNFNS